MLKAPPLNSSSDGRILLYVQLVIKSKTLFIHSSGRLWKQERNVSLLPFHISRVVSKAGEGFRKA